jgi:hypothetical protein
MVNFIVYRLITTRTLYAIGRPVNAVIYEITIIDQNTTHTHTIEYAKQFITGQKLSSSL